MIFGKPVYNSLFFLLLVFFVFPLSPLNESLIFKQVAEMLISQLHCNAKYISMKYVHITIIKIQLGNFQ